MLLGEEVGCAQYAYLEGHGHLVDDATVYTTRGLGHVAEGEATRRGLAGDYAGDHGADSALEAQLARLTVIESHLQGVVTVGHGLIETGGRGAIPRRNSNSVPRP